MLDCKRVKKQFKKCINYIIVVDESSPPSPNLYTRRWIVGRKSKERRRRVYITLEYRFFPAVNPPRILSRRKNHIHKSNSHCEQKIFSVGTVC